MAKTVADVEVKKTTAPNTTAKKNSIPAVEERPQWWGKWLWIAAPVVALAAAGTAAIVLRRWLSNDDNDERLM